MSSKSGTGVTRAARTVDRRRFLRMGAAAGGALLATNPLAARAEGNVPRNVPEWMKHEGGPLVQHAYGMPSRFEQAVMRRGRGDQVMPGAGSIMTPHQDLHGMITPNGLVFERSHAGVPDNDPAQHRLVVHGLVRQPMIFTMEDLMRFPSVSRIHFIECSGNSSREWRKTFGKTVQISHGLLSCCEWTGVLLSTILDEVGASRDARWVLAEGADPAAMTRSVPMQKCFEDAILVYGQNGEETKVHA
jgi:sulfane dehydrogenase subunit SoxC